MNKLRLWRIDRGLSQLELAEASGVSRWLIQLFESGLRMPTNEQQQLFSETLGVEMQELFPHVATKGERK